MVRIKTYISWCEILQTYWLIKFFKWHVRYLNFRMPIFYHTFCVVNAVNLLLLKGSRIIPLLFKSTCMTYLYIFFVFKFQQAYYLWRMEVFCESMEFYKTKTTLRLVWFYVLENSWRLDIYIFRKINTLLLFCCEFCTTKI